MKRILSILLVILIALGIIFSSPINAESFNGRAAGFEPANEGSIPSSATYGYGGYYD